MSYPNDPCDYISDIAIKTLEIDKETAIELLKVLNHQFIDYENERVHDLIKRMWEFVGAK